MRQSWWTGLVVFAACDVELGEESAPDSVIPTVETPAPLQTTDPGVDPCGGDTLRVTGGLAAIVLDEPFVPAEEGGAITLYHPRGWHFKTSLLVENSQNFVQIAPRMSRLDTGEVIATNESTLALWPMEACAGTAYEIQLYPDTWDSAALCALDGVEVEIRWDVTDVVDDRVGSATARAVIALEPTVAAYECG